MRVVRIEKQVFLQARSEEALVRRIGTFAQALQLRSGRIVALERRLPARHGRAALICYELPLDTLRLGTVPVGTLCLDAPCLDAPRLDAAPIDRLSRDALPRDVQAPPRCPVCA